MRSLEECKREIIKKSREQIKRRKKIRISLICLALCVISVPLIIKALPEKNFSENAEEKLPYEETLIYEALPENSAQREINIKEAENEEAYSKLCGEIINIFKNVNKNSPQKPDSRNIKISLEEKSGLRHIYIISEGRITDINTGTEAYISGYEINKIIKITEDS